MQSKGKEVYPAKQICHSPCRIIIVVICSSLCEQGRENTQTPPSHSPLPTTSLHASSLTQKERMLSAAFEIQEDN